MNTAWNRKDAAIALGLLAAGVLWAIQGGKDLNWDLLHYHVYIAFGLLDGRVGADFFPAGLQSYLNPLPDLLFYAMYAAGWHSVVVASLLALTQALALVLVYLVARALLDRPDAPDRAAALLSVALAAAAVPYLSSIGRTHTDVLTALPVLAGLLLCCRPRPLRSASTFAWAGLLFGLAAGLKPTNAIYALGAGVFPVLAHGGATRRRALAVFGAAAAVGVLAGGGYWAWVLWREFGSPVFPLFNGLFHSPDFAPVNLSFDRYRPFDLPAFASAFVRMTSERPLVYGDQNSPDWRVLFLLAAVAAWGLARLPAFRARLGGTRSARPEVLRATLVFYAIALVLWILTTFNARYALPLLLVVGPLFAAVLSDFLPRRAALAAVGAALLVQTFAVVQVSPTRLSPDEPFAWSTQWLQFDVPPRLREQPHLFLSIEGQSYSFLAAQLHPGSRFASVRGHSALTLDGPGGERLRRLLEGFHGRVRSLGTSTLGPGGTTPDPEWVAMQDSALGRLGLAIDPGDCLPIKSTYRGDALAEAANRWVGLANLRYRPYPMSCALRPVPVSEAYLRGRPAADAVLDAVERACPRAFAPGLARSEQQGRLWLRSYPNSELDLMLEDRKVFSISRVDGGRTDIVETDRAGRPQGAYRCPGGR